MPRESHEFPISGYGRLRLLETAETLFDEQGLDGVSARAIALASGHRNIAAVNYHFGNRDKLVRSVLARRADDLDDARHALLDELEAAGPVTPRDVLAAALAPLIDLLDDPGGRRYLRLLNQAANHPAYYAEAGLRFASSLVRSVPHLTPLVAHLPPKRRPQRVQIALGMVIYALAEQARLLDADPPPRPVLDTATYAADLLDATIGALTASAETTRF